MQIIILLALLVLLLGASIFIMVCSVENFLRTTISQHTPFIPIPKEVVPHIVDALNIRDGSVVYDLGCGDARVLAACHARHPNARYKGVDVAFLPLLLSWLRLKKIKRPHAISICRKNFFYENISDATHIFLYLLPHVMNTLLPKIRKECKTGTRIISCDFIFEDMTPVQIIDLHRKRKLGQHIYVYTL